MNEAATTRTPVLEIAILFSAFCVLLFILIIGNPQPVNQITVQNIDQVHEVFRVETHQDGIYLNNLVLNKNSNTLSATAGGINYVWNLPDRTLQTSNLSNTGGAVYFTGFIGNKPVMTYATSSGVSILDMMTIQPIAKFQPKELLGWQLSQDGRWFALVNDKTSAQIIDLNTNKVSANLSSPEGYSFSDQFVFSADDQFIASLLHSNTCNCRLIVIWNLSSGEEIQEYDLGEEIFPYSFDFSQDHKLFILSGHKSEYYLSDGKRFEKSSGSYVAVWNLEHGEKVAEWSGGAIAIEQLYISPDNQFIAAAGFGDVWLWDIHNINNPKELIHLENPDGSSYAFNHMAVNKDWTLLAISDKDSNILTYNLKTAKLIKTFSVITLPYSIEKILFSNDSRYLIFSCSDQSIRFWSIGEIETKPFARRETVALPTVTATSTWTLQEVIGNATTFMETSMPSSATAAAN